MAAAQRHDLAVAFCCDRKFFHFALFMIRQIAFHNPFRAFDFVISTDDDLEIPEWAKAYGIVVIKPDLSPQALKYPVLMTKRYLLHRYSLARQLQSRFRRILYLDSDMFVEGGDLSQLLTAEIGSHPVAMALDFRFFMVAEFHAPEFLKSGLSAKPYGNSGLLLIDTRAFVEQDVERRCYDAYENYPEAVHSTGLFDQPMINIALHGKFAQLAPCWNWQISDRRPFVTMTYPVFIRHFISSSKPDKDTTGKMEPRFNLAYREFLTNFMPDLLPSLSPQCDPTPVPFGKLAKHLLWHVASSQVLSTFVSRFPDPYRARI